MTRDDGLQRINGITSDDWGLLGMIGMTGDGGGD